VLGVDKGEGAAGAEEGEDEEADVGAVADGAVARVVDVLTEGDLTL